MVILQYNFTYQSAVIFHNKFSIHSLDDLGAHVQHNQLPNFLLKMWTKREFIHVAIILAYVLIDNIRGWLGIVWINCLQESPLVGVHTLLVWVPCISIHLDQPGNLIFSVQECMVEWAWYGFSYIMTVPWAFLGHNFWCDILHNLRLGRKLLYLNVFWIWLDLTSLSTLSLDIQCN